MTNIVKAALDGLNREISAGVKFPEALERVLRAYPEVSPEEVREAYARQAFEAYEEYGVFKHSAGY
jgi:Flp pilus assembly protein TadB